MGQRQVYVDLDGGRIATLLDGESVTLAVAAGPHRLKLNNTLVWKTRDVEVEPGAHLSFTVTNRAGRGTFWMVALLGAGPLFLDFDRVESLTADR